MLLGPPTLYRRMPRIYAALGDRLLAVTGGGAVERLSGRDVECVAAAGDRVLVGTFESGVFVSEDGGDSFERSWPAEAPESVTALAVSPQDDDVVWAGTEPSRVFRSGDGGATWQHRPGLTDVPSASSWSFPPRPATHHVRWIEPDPDERGRLYVGIEAGALVLTDDGGDTWRDRPEGARRDNHQLATHSDAPGRVYAAAGDGYAETPDGGDTWAYPQDGLDHRYVWGVAVHPEDPDCVVVSAASGARQAHRPSGETYVYRKTEGAWERAMDGLPGPESVARPDLATGDDGFYALSNHGIYRSARGRTWERLDVEWPETYRRQVPQGLAVE